MQERGRGVCPCETANLNCANACPRAKSKNHVLTAGIAQRSGENVILYGANHLEAEVGQSGTQMQEFIQALDNPTKDDWEIKLLSMGRGSLDFTKQPIADNLPKEPTPLADHPWHRCWVCFGMETEQENECCKKRQCITSYRAFNNVCWDRDILEVCIKAQCDIRAD